MGPPRSGGSRWQSGPDALHPRLRGHFEAVLARSPGANLAGYIKVADAMVVMGVI